MSNLSHLNLDCSVNFDNDESVTLLSNILGKAYHIKKVNIADQLGDRKVDIDVSEGK